jgi:pyridoxine 4-dehydrogenase
MLIREALRDRDDVLIRVKFGSRRGPAGVPLATTRAPRPCRPSSPTRSDGLESITLTSTVRPGSIPRCRSRRPSAIGDGRGRIRALHRPLRGGRDDSPRPPDAPDRRPADRVLAVQIEYSLISRGIEQEILPACRELRIGITAYGVLSRGLISGHWSRERSMQPDDFRAHSPRFQGEPGAQPLAGRRPARADRAEGRHGGPDRDRLGAGARRRHRAADRSSRRDRLAESLAALEVELTGDDLAAIERTVPPALRPVSATPSQGMATLDREAGARG